MLVENKNSIQNRLKQQISANTSVQFATILNSRISAFAKKLKKLPEPRTTKIWQEIRYFLRSQFRSKNSNKLKSLETGLTLRLQYLEKSLTLREKSGEVHIVHSGDTINKLMNRYFNQVSFRSNPRRFWMAFAAINRARNASGTTSPRLKISDGTSNLFIGEAINIKKAQEIFKKMITDKTNVVGIINDYLKLPENKPYLKRISRHKARIQRQEIKTRPPDSQSSQPSNNSKQISASSIKKKLNNLLQNLPSQTRSQKIASLQKGLKYTDDLLSGSSRKNKLTLNTQAKATLLNYKQTILEQLRNLEGPQIKIGQKLYDRRYNWYIGEVTTIDNKTGKATIKFYKPPITLNGKPSEHMLNKSKNYNQETEAQRWQHFYNRQLHFPVVPNGTTIIHPAKIAAVVNSKQKRGKKTVITKSRPISFVETKVQTVTTKSGKKINRINIIRQATSRFEQKSKAIQNEIQKFQETIKLRNVNYATYKNVFGYLQKIALQLNLHRKSFRTWAQSIENKWMLTWTDLGKLAGHTLAGGSASEALQAKNLAEKEYDKRNRELQKIEAKFNRFKGWSNTIFNALTHSNPIPPQVLTQMNAAANTDPYLYEIIARYKLQKRHGVNPPQKALAATNLQILKQFQKHKNHGEALRRFNQSAQKFAATTVNINGQKHSINRINGKKSISRRIHEAIMANQQDPQLRLQFTLNSADDLTKIANNSNMMAALAKEKRPITINDVNDEIIRLHKLESAMKKQKPKYFKSFAGMRSIRANAMKELNKSFFSKINWKNFKAGLSTLGSGALDVLDNPTTLLMMATGGLAMRLAGNLVARAAAAGTLKYATLHAITSGILMYPLNSGTLYALSMGREGKEIASLDPSKHGIALAHSIGMMLTGGLARHGAGAAARAMRSRFLAQAAQTGSTQLSLAQRAAIATTSSTIGFTATMGSLVSLEAGKNYALTGKAQWLHSFTHALQFDIAMRGIHFLRSGITSARMAKMQRKHTEVRQKSDLLVKEETQVGKQAKELAQELSQLKKTPNPTPQQQQRIQQIQQQQQFLNQRVDQLRGESLDLAIKASKLEIEHTQHQISQVQQQFQKGKLTQGEYNAKMNALQGELNTLQNNSKILQETQAKETTQAQASRPLQTSDLTGGKKPRRSPIQVVKQLAIKLEKRASEIMAKKVDFNSSDINRADLVRLQTAFGKIWKTLTHPKAKAFAVKTWEIVTLKGARNSEKVQALKDLWNRKNELSANAWNKVKPLWEKAMTLVKNEKVKTAPKEIPKTTEKLPLSQRSPITKLFKKFGALFKKPISLDASDINRADIARFKRALYRIKNSETTQKGKAAISKMIELVAHIAGPRTNAIRVQNLWNSLTTAFSGISQSSLNRIKQAITNFKESRTESNQLKNDLKTLTKELAAHGALPTKFKRGTSLKERIEIQRKALESIYNTEKYWRDKGLHKDFIDLMKNNKPLEKGAKKFRTLQEKLDYVTKTLNEYQQQNNFQPRDISNQFRQGPTVEVQSNSQPVILDGQPGQQKARGSLKNGTKFVAETVAKRGRQSEDMSIVDPKNNFMAAIDGMGGVSNKPGDPRRAAQILAENLRKYPTDVNKAMSEALNQMNQEGCGGGAVFAAARIETRPDGSQIAHIHWAGDARVRIRDANGHIVYETRDHSLVNQMVDQGHITPQQAANHPSRNVVTNGVTGGQPFKAPGYQTVPLKKGYKIEIMSDGISDNVSASKHHQISRGKNLEQGHDAVMNGTQDKMRNQRNLGHDDNMQRKNDDATLITATVGGKTSTTSTPQAQPAAVAPNPTPAPKPIQAPVAATAPIAKPATTPKNAPLSTEQQTRWTAATQEAKQWKVSIPKRGADGKKLSPHDRLVIAEQMLEPIHRQIGQLKTDARAAGANFDQLLAQTSRRFRQRPIAERLQLVERELNGIISENVLLNRAKLSSYGIDTWFNTKQDTRPKQLRQIDDMRDAQNRIKKQILPIAEEIGLDTQALKKLFKEIKTQASPTSYHEHINKIVEHLQQQKTRLQKEITKTQTKLHQNNLDSRIPNGNLLQQATILNDRAKIIAARRQLVNDFESRTLSGLPKTEHSISNTQNLPISSLPQISYLRITDASGKQHYLHAVKSGDKLQIASAKQELSNYHPGSVSVSGQIGTSFSPSGSNINIQNITKIEVWTQSNMRPIQNPARYQSQARP